MFFLVHQMDKVKVAASIANGVERTLVFVRTKRGADRLVTQLEREGVQRAARSTATCARVRASGRSPTSSPARSRCSSPPTSRRAASTSTASTSSCTTTRPRTTRRTSTAPAAPPARGRAASRSRCMLWNQENDIRVIQRRLGLQIPVVEVFSNDPRLADLANWDADRGRGERLTRPAPKSMRDGDARPCVPPWAHEPDLAPRRRHHRVRHARGRRQGEGAAGGGRGRHRLRCRRARLPDAGAHRRGGASPRARELARPAIHADAAGCPSSGPRSRPRPHATPATSSSRSRSSSPTAASTRSTTRSRRCSTPATRCSLPAPYWTTYPEAIDARRRRARSCVPTTARAGFRVTVEQLEAAWTPRTKALLFVSPSNPTGAVYPPDEVEAIGRWAVEHGVWVHHRRDLRAPHLRRPRVHLDAGARSRARRHLRRAQRRRQDVRDDRAGASAG